MKNQYVGDIGDYGKYGLLRYLSVNGIRIGVNWYLTTDDEIVTDGNIRGYLKDKEESIYDRDVYTLLKGLCKRNITLIQSSNIIPNAVFYSEPLTTGARTTAERKVTRNEWHRKAIQVLSDVELIFADPDNGSIADKAAVGKNGEKYTALGELKEYYDLGKDVVYYCHKARRSPSQWQKKMSELTTLCSDIKIIVLTFRRGTQRSYIFGIHPERYKLFDTLINGFLQTSWGTVALGKKNVPFFREELSQHLIIN